MLRLLLLSLIALPLAACSGMSPIVIQPSGGGGGGGAARAVLDLQFGAITAVRDCDTAGGGDFTFNVDVRSSSQGSQSVYAGTDELRSGQTTASLGSRRMEVLAEDGAWVEVTFRASEQDDPPIGAARNDRRMDNRTGRARHTYRGGQWYTTGAKSIELGDGACQVRLDYRAQS